jgi:tRNA G18 (ribose-2'-O)-methylase SpoU
MSLCVSKKKLHQSHPTYLYSLILHLHHGRKTKRINNRAPTFGGSVADRKAIDKILLQKNAGGDVISSIRKLSKDHNIPVQMVPVEKLNGLTKANHQGVVAFAAGSIHGSAAGDRSCCI